MTARPALEMGRLMRASRLPVERLGPGEYRVISGNRERYVNLNLDVPCDCEDQLYRPSVMCKHLLAVRLYEQDQGLLMELGQRLLKNQAALSAFLNEPEAA